MAKFLTDLVVKSKNRRTWILVNPLIYETDISPWWKTIVIPNGIEVDFASIPRIFWTLIGHPAQVYRRAAVVHDYLYQFNFGTRKQADQIFLEAMKADEVWWHKRKIIYLGVRMGGWVAWNKHLKRNGYARSK